jgi:SAM-dependent methyltransferase
VFKVNLEKTAKMNSEDEYTHRQNVDAVFDTLADNYDQHFEAAHRAAYDTLSWEYSVALLPDRPSVIIDAGCGVGRWAERFVADGHHVIGIEPAPHMVTNAARRADRIGHDRFEVVSGSMEDTSAAPPGCADLIVAMGSLQYVTDDSRAISNFASWLRPGGGVAILVDSFVALVLELLRVGKTDESLERLRTGYGRWAPQGERGPKAQLRLYNAERLSALLSASGFVDINTHGLLVSATAIGGEGFAQRLSTNAGELEVQRVLSQSPDLADVGKQLLVTARRPA